MYASHLLWVQINTDTSSIYMNFRFALVIILMTVFSSIPAYAYFYKVSLLKSSDGHVVLLLGDRHVALVPAEDPLPAWEVLEREVEGRDKLVVAEFLSDLLKMNKKIKFFLEGSVIQKNYELSKWGESARSNGLLSSVLFYDRSVVSSQNDQFEFVDADHRTAAMKLLAIPLKYVSETSAKFKSLFLPYFGFVDPVDPGKIGTFLRQIDAATQYSPEISDVVFRENGLFDDLQASIVEKETKSAYGRISIQQLKSDLQVFLDKSQNQLSTIQSGSKERRVFENAFRSAERGVDSFLRSLDGFLYPAEMSLSERAKVDSQYTITRGVLEHIRVHGKFAGFCDSDFVQQIVELLGFTLDLPLLKLFIESKEARTPSVFLFGSFHTSVLEAHLVELGYQRIDLGLIPDRDYSAILSSESGLLMKPPYEVKELLSIFQAFYQH